MKYIYNHIPDEPKDSDHKFLSSPHFQNIPLPPKTNNRANCPPVLDQGQLGSCGLNSSGNMMLYAMKKLGLANPFLFSRLGVYYDTRVEMKTVKQDSGVENRNVMDVIRNQGYAPETLWTYDISKFKQKPPDTYYAERKKHLALESLSLNTANLTEVKTCLAQGWTFFAGFNVPAQFECDVMLKTGAMPLKNWHKLSGDGHDVHFVDYNDDLQVFICQNSWGDKVMDAGYFEMPHSFFTKNADSAWTVRKLS